MAFNTKIYSDRALVMFRLQTPATTSTVHLLGSWDNFSSPLLMSLDTQASAGLWKICLGSSTSGNGSASRGLKMGARYTYYFMIDGHLPTVDHGLRERDVDARTEIACNVLHVPIEVAPGVRVEASSPELSSASRQSVEQPSSNEKLDGSSMVVGLGLDLMASSSINFQELKPKQRPARPTVMIPSTIPENDLQSSANMHNISFVNSGWNKVSLNTPVSSVPSLTPTTTFSTAISPSSTISSFNTPASTGSLRGKKSFGFGFGRGDKDLDYKSAEAVHETQVSMTSMTEKEKKRTGFLPSILRSNSSKTRANFPTISNPIPINLDITSGVQKRVRCSPDKNMMIEHVHAEYCYNEAAKFHLKVQRSSPEFKANVTFSDQTVPRSMTSSADLLSLPQRHQNMSPISRCTSIDSTCSSDSSPSLTQSEFSVESSSSPDNLSTSSISSSPMGSSFGSDIEIDDDDDDSFFVNTLRGNLYSERHGRGSLELVGDDNLDEMENWYRNAAMKSRFSSISSKTNITRISDSSAFTQFEDSQEYLCSQRYSKKKRSSPKPAPQLYAPVPQRLGTKDIVTIEGLAEVEALANPDYVMSLARLRLEAENSQLDRQQLFQEMGCAGPNVV